MTSTPEKEAYVAQLTCLNIRLESIVEHLLHDSPTPRIILLQGDHGHGRIPLHVPDVDAVTPDRIAERAYVFAAYYLPGTDHGIVNDHCPVDLFPTVFRHYFRAALPQLADKPTGRPGVTCSSTREYTEGNAG